MDQHVKWAEPLLSWFYRNRRDLPWRTEGRRDPYSVWVSEIMLQQTRVEAVRPYYENWMEHFPTVEALAAADGDEVLRQWQGLGYYSRARNLHDSVKEVVSRYGGRIPAEKSELLTLKGIGDYTAGAISSLAYNKDETAVDGNVLRVFARLYGIRENILSAKVKKKVTELAREQLPEGKAGVFNEALIEFGALLCIPKSPKCGECPLMHFCEAKATGLEKELPLRITGKDTPTERYAVLICRKGHTVLIHRRPSEGLLASMWEFPMVRCDQPHGDGAGLRHYLSGQGLVVSVEETVTAELKHVFSHKKWDLAVYEGRYVSGELAESEVWRWLPVEKYTALPWAGPHGKLTACL